MARKAPHPHKYALYERSVQSPDYHAEWFVGIYKDLRGCYPQSMREDFCGTFALSCEWVKRNRRNTALGVDLDPEPLDYGRKTHLTKLTAEQRKRIKILNDNVLSITSPKVDVVLACNFSYCIFKDRVTLVRYPRGCLRLARQGRSRHPGPRRWPGHGSHPCGSEEDGLFPRDRQVRLHLAPKILRSDHARRVLRHPLQAAGRHSGIDNAFTYDWRLWTIPEVKDAMVEAGFKDVAVFWETEHEGEGTGEYVRSEHGDNAYAWVAYIAGLN